MAGEGDLWQLLKKAVDAGWRVETSIPLGFPDCVVTNDGRYYLVELKDRMPGDHLNLSPEQINFACKSARAGAAHRVLWRFNKKDIWILYTPSLHGAVGEQEFRRLLGEDKDFCADPRAWLQGHHHFLGHVGKVNNEWNEPHLNLSRLLA